MCKICRAALTTILIISFAAIAWAQASAVPASSSTSETQQGTVAVPEDVLTPLIGQPEHHFHMASRYFAHGDRTHAAAEIRAGAALLKLEAGRHDATNKAGLEDAAKHLDDLAAGVANGSVWTTDKDGIVPALLSAEITARMGRDPGELYVELTREFGEPVYDRVETPATSEQKKILAQLSPQQIPSADLAGEKIQSILTKTPGNGAPIGGLKVTTASGWFAARPSGTEDIYKIYAESFGGAGHLRRILAEAQAIVGGALAAPTQQPKIASR